MRQPLTRARRAARDPRNEGPPECVVAEVLPAWVSLPALYAHVIDKRDLLQGIVSQELDVMLAGFRAVDAPDALTPLAPTGSHIDYACANPDFFRAMFLFRPELTAESSDQLVARKSSVRSLRPPRRLARRPATPDEPRTRQS